MTQTEEPKNIRYKAFSPKGKGNTPIVGTYDSINATAWAYVTKQGDDIDVEYLGESKVDWDSQSPQTDEDGHDLYVDDDRCIIKEKDIVWKPYCPGCDEIKKEEDLDAEGYCAACAART